MGKGSDCDYGQQNISVVICDRYSVTFKIVMVATVKLLK